MSANDCRAFIVSFCKYPISSGNYLSFYHCFFPKCLVQFVTDIRQVYGCPGVDLNYRQGGGGGGGRRGGGEGLS